MTSSTVPTESFSVLLTDLGFLARALDGQKPCFKKKYYVTSGSWTGWAYRALDSESQSVNGLAAMISICRRANETYSTYKTDNVHGPKLKTKIIEARKGLDRIRRTYESEGKIIEAENIENQVITLLDNVLPMEDRIREGFTLAKPNENNEIEYEAIKDKTITKLSNERKDERRKSTDSKETQNNEDIKDEKRKSTDSKDTQSNGDDNFVEEDL